MSTKKSLRDLPDEQLVEHAVNDACDRDRAFKILYDRLTPALRRHLRLQYGLNREKTEDVLQDTWTRVHRHLHRYDGKKASFRTWLYTISTRLAINALRDDDRSPVTLRSDLKEERDAEADDRPLQFEDPDADPELEAERREARKKVRRTVADLRPRYRAVIRMRHFEGKTYEEIAEELGVPMGTVKSRIYRSRRALEGRLSEFTAGNPVGS